MFAVGRPRLARGIEGTPSADYHRCTCPVIVGADFGSDRMFAFVTDGGKSMVFLKLAERRNNTLPLPVVYLRNKSDYDGTNAKIRPGTRNTHGKFARFHFVRHHPKFAIDLQCPDHDTQQVVYLV